jgi:hypothetical protein
MESYSVRYRFAQPFDFSAETAYGWCTDYQPDDLARMGRKGTRKIDSINEDALILTDTVVDAGKRVRASRLVRLNPDRLSWTSTHLTGTNKFSQFWCQILPEGETGSRLEFIGLHVNYGRRPSPARIGSMARELADADSSEWMLLAKAMKEDLAPRRSRGTSRNRAR